MTDNKLQWDDLSAWTGTPRGRLLLRREWHQLDAVLPRLRGFRMLQIGEWDLDQGLLADSNTLRQWVLGRGPSAYGHKPQVIFNGEDLPVASKCLDAVILPHSLETTHAPHKLLREVDRVLCDRGQVVIMGFNPYSIWSIGRRMANWRRADAPQRLFYSLGRMVDWINLLDFELVSAARYGVGFPYLPVKGLDIEAADWRRLPALMAQAYIMVARKRVIPLTPTAARAWRRRSPARGAGMPEPTVNADVGPRAA